MTEGEVFMDFKLPDIGEGVHEGEIVKWLVKEGDKVAADQPMVEVMTDKATVEIPSPVAGTVSKLHAKEGQTIEVGKVIIQIAEGGGKAEAPKPQKASQKQERPERPVEKTEKVERVDRTERTAPVSREPASTPRPSQEAEAHPFHVLATPATRKLARDLGVDLKSVQASGPHGRVTKIDVQMAYEGRQAATARPSHTNVVGTSVATLPSRAPTPHVQKGALQKVPLKGVRKKIAEAMAHSKHTAAHFTYVEEVDMSAIVKLRASAADEAAKRGVKLTYLPFIIKALIPALTEFPFLNSSLDDENQEIILKGDYNIGIATDTPQGLMVPVVKNADQKSLWEIASEIALLSEKARTGKIALEDLKGGTFTVTNAGSIGGVLATPVINHPEVAILGVNAIRKRPIVKNDQIVIGDVMFLSLSVDHRVVDGADAARFMNRLIYFLAEPTRLVFA
jgi:pyruvate dehydrogenase E2 component (dihydrolipoamide acetyltransferase)